MALFTSHYFLVYYEKVFDPIGAEGTSGSLEGLQYIANIPR
jgi:hypothetical protein